MFMQSRLQHCLDIQRQRELQFTCRLHAAPPLAVAKNSHDRHWLIDCCIGLALARGKLEGVHSCQKPCNLNLTHLIEIKRTYCTI